MCQICKMCTNRFWPYGVISLHHSKKDDMCHCDMYCLREMCHHFVYPPIIEI